MLSINAQTDGNNFMTSMKNIALMDVNVAGDLLTKKMCVTSINGYQKYISPHKGFACAYRVLHDGNSCSQAGKELIQEFGVIKAIPLIRKQFQDCKSASLVLKSRSYSFNGDLSKQVTSACILTPDDLIVGAMCCDACHDTYRDALINTSKSNPPKPFPCRGEVWRGVNFIASISSPFLLTWFLYSK